MDQLTSNFDFLDHLDNDLANLGRLAESYFQDDPSTSLIKLRQFSERLTRRHAAMVGADIQDGDTQADILRRLKYDRATPESVLDVLHHTLEAMQGHHLVKVMPKGDGFFLGRLIATRSRSRSPDGHQGNAPFAVTD